MDDRGGAALDLHQGDLIFSRHQDVLLVVEHCGQVHTPNEMREAKLKLRNMFRVLYTFG